VIDNVVARDFFDGFRIAVFWVCVGVAEVHVFHEEFFGHDVGVVVFAGEFVKDGGAFSFDFFGCKCRMS